MSGLQKAAASMERSDSTLVVVFGGGRVLVDLRRVLVGAGVGATVGGVGVGLGRVSTCGGVWAVGVGGGGM
jgi:hypothetical protein